MGSYICEKHNKLRMSQVCPDCYDELVDVCRKALRLGEDHLPGCACMGCKTKREIRAALAAVEPSDDR